MEEEETSHGTSHGKAGVAGMMEKTGMEGMIPTRMARMRSTPAGTVLQVVQEVWSEDLPDDASNTLSFGMPL